LLTVVPVLAVSRVYGDPASVYVEDDIGYQFSIAVKIEDGVDVAGYSVGASWDPSILECDIDGPNSGVAYGGYLGGSTLPIAGTIDNVTGEINPKYGWSTLGSPVSGNGTLAYIDFEFVGLGFTWINLSVVLSDDLGGEYQLPTDNVSAENFHVVGDAHPMILDIENDPISSPGQMPGVYLNGSTVACWPVIVQQAYDNITETYYDPMGVIWQVFYPNGSAATMPAGIPWFFGPMPYVYTFNAADDTELGDWTVTAQADVPQMNANYPSMNQSNLASHIKTIVLPLLGAVLDLYTETERAHGYTAVMIGEGYCIPADSYTMDENVTLWVNLTYNGAELQSRLIAWEVKDATNTSVLFRTTYTDANGMSTISFRIITVCLDPEFAAGQWCVIAKTTVGEVIVEDYLTFQVGYIIELWEDMFAMPGEFARGDFVLWFYAFHNLALGPRNVTYTMTLCDDLGVPVAVASVQVTTMGVATWVKDPNATCCYSWTLIPGLDMGAVFFMVPKWSYPGTGAVIYHNVYTDYPFDCGVAWGPEIAQPVTINA
jgi:hypothetical protein